MPTVAVIRLEGVDRGVAASARSTCAVSPALERAFKTRGLKAVALAINSPGGSPAQSALLYRAPHPPAARGRARRAG